MNPMNEFYVHLANNISTALDTAFKTHVGFVLLSFNFNTPDGRANYISNGCREDIIKYLRETANRLEMEEDDAIMVESTRDVH